MKIPRPNRVVLMIDLAPLVISTTNRNEYITGIVKSAANILSFAPISNALCAFKFFFSSLSPIISTSRVLNLIGKSSTFLSFDFPLPTAISLSKTLHSIQIRPQDAEFPPNRASLLLESLVQLGLECCWNQSEEGEREGEGKNGLCSENLVLLFSKFPCSVDQLVGFLGGDRLMVKDDSFGATFSQIFASANTIFGSRDVHLSWIGVGHDDIFISRIFRRVIMSVGWGFCSTDEIVLGSVFVPFGMIFPNIGYNLGFALSDCGCSKQRVELSLQISDANGDPLNCKCCDLEILHLKPSKRKCDKLLFRTDGDSSSNMIATICVKEVWKFDERVNIDFKSQRLVLLHEFSQDRKSDREGGEIGNTSVEFVGDKILKLLCPEWCSFTEGQPIWQVILSFLYRRNMCALVSVNGVDGCSFIGIIKPFTVHAALLYIYDSRPTEFEITHSISEGEKGSNKSKKGLVKLCNMSWSSLQTSVYSSQTNSHIGLDLELEEVCFIKSRNISKKMRFLQCWMKQVKRSHYCLQTKTNIPVYELNDAIEPTKEGSIASSSSTGVPDFTSQSEIEKSPLFDDVDDFDFISGEDIGQKIESGLCFEGVDLRNFAERLVELAIRDAYKKLKNKDTQDDTHDDFGVINEVIKVLLVKPKDLAAKYKNLNLLATAPSNLNSTTSSCLSKKVKEHELQIMFRMEILRSSMGTSIEDNTKGKFVKEICSFLVNIEFNLQGFMFGGESESLFDFSERTIKARYFHCLEDVISRIYTQMEFLSFDGGDDQEDSCDREISNSNTNDGRETAMEDKENKLVTKKDTDINPKESKNAHQLLKAQERRERARTFSHFASRTQNLQRVWAPKQQSKETRSMYKKSISNKLGGKRRRISCNDMVLETPMKLLHSTEEEEHEVQVCKPSFKRTLFRDEDDKSDSQCDSNCLTDF